jgi:phospholipid/cholesterol/gamma-HCH transport system ATP-binding protein
MSPSRGGDGGKNDGAQDRRGRFRRRLRPDRPEPASPTEAEPSAEYSIEVTDLHKGFGAREVLRGLNLRCPPNSITTVLGPSGVGKSVLIKHLVGLLEPDAGTVRIFGENLWALSREERRNRCARMGMLFQDGGLISSLNVYDNVALPLRTHTTTSEQEVRDIVMDHLRAVGLEDEVERLPGEMSGGMRKRAAFARALVLHPRLVFFDEPDSGLDPVRTNLLNELILDIHQKQRGTYLLVTHYTNTARMISDYIALLWQGRIVCYGTPDEVFASQEPFVRQFLSGETAGPLGMK